MKILRLLLIVFSFLFMESSAQKASIDTLKSRLSVSKSVDSSVVLLSKVGMRYYASQVYYDSAFYYVDKALFLAKEDDLQTEIARNLFNLGAIMTATNRYEEALQYYDEVIPVLLALDRKKDVSSAYNNIGANYFELGNYDAAVTNYNKSLEIGIEIEDLYGQGISYMNIGEVNFVRGAYEEANANFEKSLKTLSLVNYNPPTIHLFYARSLFAANENDKALEEAQKAFDAAETDNNMKYISESSKLLSEIYGKTLNYKEAYKFHQTYATFNDSINAARDLSEIEKLNLNFELKKNKEALAHISEKNKYQSIIYILATVGIIMLAFLISRQLKISKMTKNIHDIQIRLVEPEIKEREKRRKEQYGTPAKLSDKKEGGVE